MTSASDHTLFGYGSLILPTSVLGRFIPQMQREVAQRLKEQEGDRLEIMLDYFISDEALALLETTDLEFVPAKIGGFKRFYALETDNQNQLMIEQSGNDDDVVNGVIVIGLTSEQFTAVDATEKGFETVTRHSDRFDLYIENAVDLPETVPFFIPAMSNPHVNKTTLQHRNPHYHRFIQEGVKLLAQHWYETETEQERFKKEFMADYRASTYERTKNGWKALSDIE